MRELSERNGKCQSALITVELMIAVLLFVTAFTTPGMMCPSKSADRDLVNNPVTIIAVFTVASVNYGYQHAWKAKKNYAAYLSEYPLRHWVAVVIIVSLAVLISYHIAGDPRRSEDVRNDLYRFADTFSLVVSFKWIAVGIVASERHKYSVN